jgi:lipoprotein-anchoring transpeptidase ErfK/SrfK
MNDDELARLLSDAFSAQARNEVSDVAMPPPPRFVTERAPRTGRQRAVRMIAPLTAAAAVIAVVAVLGGIMNRPSNDSHQAVGSHSNTTALPSTRPVVGTPVHIRLQQRDGVRVGVGMPVIAYFSRHLTDARALSTSTTVHVNGKPTKAAWYFEASDADPAYPVEGHLRPEHFWPAHARVDISIASQGLTAGKGMSFDNNLSLDFSTGAQMVATVDDVSHKMSVVEDGKPIGTYPVSLGTRFTPTTRGVKVIMEQGGKPVCMTVATSQVCNIKFLQRLTYDGEYLHAAPWNVKNIGHKDTSNGCTNLMPADAKKLYNLFEVGDVVQYPNTSGATMKLGSGYGDWNVSWALWQTGGLVPTS